MKKNFFSSLPSASILWAITLSIVSVSTNEVYGTFIAHDVNRYIALCLFSLFAFLATYPLIFREPNPENEKRTFFYPFELILKQFKTADTKGRLLMLSTIFAYTGYFYCLISALKTVDAFSIVTISSIGALINIILSMLIFKDRVENIKIFFTGFLISVIGILLFAKYDTDTDSQNKMMQTVLNSDKHWGYFYLIMQICLGSYSYMAKTALRRVYGFNPEHLTLLPFLAAAIMGILLYEYVPNTGGLPNLQQLLLLLYIGIVPTAFVNIESQKLKDSLGIPMFMMIGMPRPVYILIVKGVLFVASPISLYLGLNGTFSNPLHKSLIVIVWSLFVVFGAWVANQFGKPIPPNYSKKDTDD
jgi:drug/metabolite transporter (DMT)-like permease